jgi:hypothetical protein
MCRQSKLVQEPTAAFCCCRYSLLHVSFICWLLEMTNTRGRGGGGVGRHRPTMSQLSDLCVPWHQGRQCLTCDALTIQPCGIPWYLCVSGASATEGQVLPSVLATRAFHQFTILHISVNFKQWQHVTVNRLRCDIRYVTLQHIQLGSQRVNITQIIPHQLLSTLDSKPYSFVVLQMGGAVLM